MSELARDRGVVNRARNGEGERHLPGSAEAVYLAAQRLLLHRIELFQLEMQETLTRLLGGSLVTIGGGLLVLLGWITGVVGVVMWIGYDATAGPVLTVVGAVHVVLGAGIAVLGMATSRGSQRRHTRDRGGDDGSRPGAGAPAASEGGHAA